MQKVKKFIAASLAALLLVSVPARSMATVAYADAASATITVAALGGGGLGAAAVGSVAAGVVGGVLLSLGVSAFVNAADASGMSKTEYLGSLMQDWSSTEYGNAQQLAEDVAYSTYITADGALHIKNAAAQKIKDFGDWLFSRGDIPIYPAAPYGVLLGTDALSVPLGYQIINTAGRAFTITELTVDPVSAAPYIIYAYNSSGVPNCFFVCANACTIRYRYDFGTSNYGNTSYCTSRNDSGLFYDSNPVFRNVNSLVSDSTPLATNRLPFNGLAISYPTAGIIGNPVDWAENQDVIDLGMPDAGDITLNPDVLPNLDISGIGAGTSDLVISLQDYIQSLIDVINGYRDRLIELEDALTGEKVGVAELPDIQTLDPSITVPLNPDVYVPSDSIGIIDGEIPAPPPPVPPSDQLIADYSYDLTSVFPFCIPFDIVRALSLLNAEPEAPKASFTWDIPLIGLDYTMEIDLSPWSGAAQILRTMELLVFTIGLGMVSRKLIMA